VVEEGTGPVVEPGDLIQVSLWYWSNKDNRLERRDINRWIWVGFRTKEETPFYSIGPNFVSTFVGLKEEGIIKFLREYDPGEDRPREYKMKVPGQLYLNPFGATRSIWRETIGKKEENIYIPHDAYYFTEVGQENPKTTYVPAAPGYTVVHIKKVFKGQLRYRTTRLYDDTWIHYCYNWFSCKFINDSREGWVDDARYDGVSSDGRKATFQYGPVATPGRRWKRPGSVPLGEKWTRSEWKSLPVGVQVK
jgi:hypothetical protein